MKQDETYHCLRAAVVERMILLGGLFVQKGVALEYIRM